MPRTALVGRGRCRGRGDECGCRGADTPVAARRRVDGVATTRGPDRSRSVHPTLGRVCTPGGGGARPHVRAFLATRRPWRRRRTAPRACAADAECADNVADDAAPRRSSPPLLQRAAQGENNLVTFRFATPWTPDATDPAPTASWRATASRAPVGPHGACAYRRRGTRQKAIWPSATAGSSTMRTGTTAAVARGPGGTKVKNRPPHQRCWAACMRRPQVPAEGSDKTAEPAVLITLVGNRRVGSSRTLDRRRRHRANGMSSGKVPRRHSNAPGRAFIW